MLSTFCLNAFAQPANDNVCDAEVILVDGSSIVTDNTGATTQTSEVTPPQGTPPEPCFTAWCDGDQNVQASVWFQFTAPSNGAININTCLPSTALDTQIALWSASDCAEFNTYLFIKANDDMPNDCNLGNLYSASMFVYGLTADAVYYIQVDSYDGAEGLVEIEVVSAVPMTQINFVHNSVDLSINAVDIRLGGELIVDNLMFRTNSTFIEIPADVEVNLTINDSNSIDDSEPLLDYISSFSSQQIQIATLTGIYSESGYTPAPPLGLSVFENALIYSPTPGILPLLFFNGVTETNPLDIQNAETLVLLNDDLAYGDYSNEGYIFLNAENFSVHIFNEFDPDATWNYCLPFSFANQTGAAFTLVLSGFINPVNNSNGASVGLFAVNHFDGSFVELDAGVCEFPDNDDICQAQMLIVDAPPSSFDNSFATVQLNESSPYNLPNNDPEVDCLTEWCDGTLDNTLWFKFIAPPTNAVMVTTCFDTTFDTQITICSVGNCSDFSTVTYLASNDDMAGGCSGGDTYASNLIYANLTPGAEYHIQLDGWEGDIGPSQIEVTSVSSVHSNLDKLISIFPNPAHDQITITGITPNSNVSLIDVSGKIVYRGSFSESYGSIHRLNTNHLTPGVYALRIMNAIDSITKMIVIE